MNDCLLEQKAKRRDVNLYQFYCAALVSQSTNNKGFFFKLLERNQLVFRRGHQVIGISL